MLSMHCAELILSFLADEDRWQMGPACRQGMKIVLNYIPDWRTNVFFIAKATLHWIFDFAVSFDGYFTVSLLPLTATTVTILLINIAFEFLTRIPKERKRSQPSTYGNFRLMQQYMLKEDEGPTTSILEI